jgi:Zn-dependent metalloprotease
VRGLRIRARQIQKFKEKIMKKSRCRQAHRHSIYCIIPPYVLDRIALNGSDEQRAFALRTRSYDNTFRAMRIAALTSRAANPQLPTAFNPALEMELNIYNAHNQQNLPGELVFSQGQDPSTITDDAVREAYEGLKATFDFYSDIFGRNSIDDEGLPLIASVHYGDRYDNAFWNSQQMVFGDGDGELFNRFTIALDVIAHELTHGVTEDEAQLVYFQQSGALNESVSDVFGSLIKQYVLKQTAEEADWLIGKGLLTDNVNGKALRSMAAPGTAFDDPILGKDPQPAHMKKYVNTMADNGGVHINSGIPNHAFYLAATRLGGYAWEKAGRIWYRALISNQLKPIAQFRRFARITEDVTKTLYGLGSEEHKIVRASWSDVGINLP